MSKPSTLIPANIKKDVNIGGVVGTLESGSGGDTSETWVLNDLVDCGEFGLEPVSANFISNSQQFIGIASRDIGELLYEQDEDSVSVFSEENSAWIDSAYRKLTFTIAPTGDLLTWLQANGVKQEKNLAIQPSKNLTITSNGTTTITPDVPYDAMGQVGVTVNVGGSSGYESTNLTIILSSDYLFNYLTVDNGQLIRRERVESAGTYNLSAFRNSPLYFMSMSGGTPYTSSSDIYFLAQPSDDSAVYAIIKENPVVEIQG